MVNVVDLDKNQQISCTITGKDWLYISELSKKEHRSLSGMASILLQQAIKERKRKRKNAKEI